MPLNLKIPCGTGIGVATAKVPVSLPTHCMYFRTTVFIYFLYPVRFKSVGVWNLNNRGRGLAKGEVDGEAGREEVRTKLGNAGGMT